MARHTNARPSIDMNDGLSAPPRRGTLTAGPRKAVRNDEVVDTFQAICAHQHPAPHIAAA
jgi:hypothetical protein